MRKLLLGLVVCLSLCGCGGGGGGNTTPSPFAGTWLGPWSDTNSQSGTLSITVAANGAMTGTIVNNTLGTNGTTAGTVSNGGNLSATYTYPTATYTANGTVAIGGNGHITGNLQEFQGGTLLGSAVVDLTKQ